MVSGMEERENMEQITTLKVLTEEERIFLDNQNSRPISDFMRIKFEKDAQRYWDLFYKRNCEKFFKNRYWTTKEFEELAEGSQEKSLLEIGCGVGNLIYPLVEEGFFRKIYACDFSPRAIEFVKLHPRYNTSIITAFQADVTQFDSLSCVIKEPVDIVTMVFVLSAINPEKFRSVIQNLLPIVRTGTIIFFRDYGIYDMTQLRFKPGHKISDKYYVRQDGTRSYFFTIEELKSLFESGGFTEVSNNYIHRRTVNKKELIDVPRIFIQLQSIPWRLKWL